MSESKLSNTRNITCRRKAVKNIGHIQSMKQIEMLYKTHLWFEVENHMSTLRILMFDEFYKEVNICAYIPWPYIDILQKAQ